MSDPWERIKQRRFQYIRKRIKGKTLDIGCGYGELRQYLPENSSYVGLDISESFIKKLKDQGTQAHKIDVSSQTLPFSDDTFDTVIIGEILEHLENPVFALKEAKRILKKEGKIVGDVPNDAESFRNVIIHSFKAPNIKNIDRSHINAFGIRELINLLYRCGFDIKVIKKICCEIPKIHLMLPDKRVFSGFARYIFFVLSKPDEGR